MCLDRVHTIGYLLLYSLVLPLSVSVVWAIWSLLIFNIHFLRSPKSGVRTGHLEALKPVFHQHRLQNACSPPVRLLISFLGALLPLKCYYVEKERGATTELTSKKPAEAAGGSRLPLVWNQILNSRFQWQRMWLWTARL